MDLSKDARLNGFGEIFADVHRAAPDARWTLVGAMARDLRLSYAYGIELSRATGDIDIALAVSSWQEFAEIRQLLLDSRLFTASHLSQRVMHASGIAIDIVPFGQVAHANGELVWPPDGAVRMNVLGFEAAFSQSTAVKLPHSTIQVVTLPALLVLKFFAYADRKTTARGKDATDIHLVLRNYLDAGNRDRMFSDHSDLLENDDFDYSAAGARLAGRDVRTALAAQDDAEVFRELSELVIGALDPPNRYQIVEQVPPEARTDFEMLLLEFSKGLNGG